MPRRPRPDRRAAFTLIELLVVLAIITILAAITLPMVPALHDAARIGTCESRLQQIGVALRLYAEDYQAHPPDLETLYAARYLEQRSLLRCCKTGQAYFYRPVPPAANRETVIAACCDPAAPPGSRPHRHRTATVRLHVHGGSSLLR